MTSFLKHRQLIVAVACVSLAASSASRAAAPGANALPSLSVKDVRLGEGGTLRGQLVDRQGQAVVNAAVVLSIRGNSVSKTVTDPRGEFRFEELRGGVYKLVAGNSGGIYRLWTATAAPPASHSSILLVDGPAVRGQQDGLGAGHYDGAILRSLNSPWVLAGLVGAGMAVPIAISNNDDASGS